ncbi:MAG: DUF1697 domain-containing protein [Acidobacteriota bacterium]|nr:DUF1697 domain-containing protein [Acidobacteriota bacterium]
MTVIVSMLRGVNVGSHKRMKMDALRGVYEALGLQAPQTYVQSGNVIFGTEQQDLVQLTKRIEDGIERSFGFRPTVVVRTCSELRGVIARNPFALRSGIEPSKLLVIFFAADPGPGARSKILGLYPDTEEFATHGRELYIYFPDGMARPKLSPAIVEKTLKTSGTARNWNSVSRMLEIAERLETAG